MPPASAPCYSPRILTSSSLPAIGPGEVSHPSGVIYVHQDQLSIGECIRRLKDYADILEAEDMQNRVEFL